jgi:hypothetical protein
MAKAPSGDDFMTGYFSTPILKIRSLESANRGNNDIFVAKFDSGGNEKYIITYGGANDEIATKIVVDSSDNIYITGYFIDCIDFGTFQLLAPPPFGYLGCSFEP